MLLMFFICVMGASSAAQSGIAQQTLPVTTELRGLSGAEFKKLRDSGARIDLIDVRMPEDYRKLHLVGARNVPFYVIGRAGIPEKRSIVLYCSGLQCNLGTESARTLLNLGYKNVQVLDGGLEAAVAAGCMAEGTGSMQRKRRIILTADLAARLASAQPPVLLDVRSQAAFSAGHLPGARNLPLEKLKEQVPEFPADRSIVLYDSSLERAGSAAGLLGKSGREVWELEGGLALWTSEGRPLVSGPAVP